MMDRRAPALVIVDQGKVTVDGHPGSFENLDAALTWLESRGEPAEPDVVLSIVWPGDPIPPDCDEHIELTWPGDVQNGDLSAYPQRGIPKGRLNPLRAL